MGLKDFVRGAIDAGTDIAASAGAKTVVDWATEPVERVGNVLTGAGKGINAVSDQAGKLGDLTQKGLNAVGAPKPIGSVANFMTGGATQWAGRSVGDLTQVAGTLGENIDTMATGAGKAANFVDEHPDEARLLAGAAGTWALNHKMDIAKGVGKAALDEATDPASLAMMALTGGTSVALKGGLTAGAKAAAEGGLKAGIKAGAAEAGTALLRGGTRAAVEESAEAATTAIGKTGVRQAATNLVKDTFTGRNLPAADTPGVMGRFDRALEKTTFRPNPNGRLARFRAGQAEKIVGEGGGIVREAIGNRVRAGGGKPMYGGDAAVNAWRMQGAVRNTNRLGAAGEAAGESAVIAADPTGYAVKKAMSMRGDTASTGAVVSDTTTGASTDLIQPGMGARVGYSNKYTPRGSKQPSILPSRGGH